MPAVGGHDPGACEAPLNPDGWLKLVDLAEDSGDLEKSRKLPSAFFIALEVCGMSGLVCPSSYRTFQFPHLERLTVLEPGPGLIRAAQGRKEHGVPLQTVVIGTEHGDPIFVGLTLFRRTL